MYEPTIDEIKVFSICKRVGVPSMWYDDVYNEALYDQLNDNRQFPIAYYSRRRAIDYAQRFGSWTRGGNLRPEQASIESDTLTIVDERDGCELAETCLEFRRVIAGLTPVQRNAVGKCLRGDALTKSERETVIRLRPRFQELYTPVLAKADRDKEIIRMRRNDVPVNAIAKRFNITRVTVSRIVSQAHEASA